MKFRTVTLNAHTVACYMYSYVKRTVQKFNIYSLQRPVFSIVEKCRICQEI